jgi:hypothetical protein
MRLHWPALGVWCALVHDGTAMASHTDPWTPRRKTVGRCTHPCAHSASTRTHMSAHVRVRRVLREAMRRRRATQSNVQHTATKDSLPASEPTGGQCSVRYAQRPIREHPRIVLTYSPN